MLFLHLIIKNLLSRKTRTVLTVAGIGIGIATIVVFGMVSEGLKSTMASALKPGKADFTVVKAGSADLIVSTLTDKQIQTIRSVPGIAEVSPYVMAITQMKGNPYFLIGGMKPSDAAALGVKIESGRVFGNDNEIMLGRIAAKNRNLKPGDKLAINNKQYTITGIFESGVTMQDGGAATTVAEAQRIQGLTNNQVSMAMVNVKPGENPREVANRVEAKDKNLLGIVEVQDYNEVDQGLVIVDSASWAISALAIVIGGIGVMNTIIMSVFERTREIGVLRAMGWKRRRVVSMILGEALVIAVFAAAIGIAIGLGLTWLIMQSDMGRSWLSINLDLAIMVRALAVAVSVVIVGAAYPAYRATRFSPMEALRYE